MGAKRIIVGFCVLAFSVPAVLAGDAIDASIATTLGVTETSTLPSSAGATGIEPWIHADMPEDMRTRLEAGFELAVKRVVEVPECSGLFESLGADPIETLRSGLYFPINSHRKEKAVCGQAVAYTNVGAAPTFLCRDFARQSDERAAMYIVHEALHHAGLTEKPHDQGAMTSREINSMVTTACNF